MNLLVRLGLCIESVYLFSGVSTQNAKSSPQDLRKKRDPGKEVASRDHFTGKPPTSFPGIFSAEEGPRKRGWKSHTRKTRAAFSKAKRGVQYLFKKMTFMIDEFSTYREENR